jgi:hypothetical protein
MLCFEVFNGLKCGGYMKRGLVVQDVWGRLDGQPAENGDTLNSVDSTIHTDALKCDKCGHTVSNKRLVK